MSSIPEGVSLSTLGRAVFRVLQAYTAFPWPVLSTQCKRASVDPSTLGRDDLARIIPALASGVARFTTPLNEPLVQRDLRALLERDPG